MACLKSPMRVLAELLGMVLILVCPMPAGAQSVLPADAQQVLRQTASELLVLAERYSAGTPP
jgi:hypothetical protein